MSQTNLQRVTKAVYTVPPLCVDLDGTLIMTNTLHEALIAVAGNPVVLASIPRWLVAGKAVLKRELVRRASLDPALLPYNQPLLEYLRREKASGTLSCWPLRQIVALPRRCRRILACSTKSLPPTACVTSEAR